MEIFGKVERRMTPYYMKYNNDEMIKVMGDLWELQDKIKDLKLAPDQEMTDVPAITYTARDWKCQSSRKVHSCYSCGLQWPCEGAEKGSMCECLSGCFLRDGGSWAKDAMDYFCSEECMDRGDELMDAHMMVTGSYTDPKNLLPK